MSRAFLHRARPEFEELTLAFDFGSEDVRALREFSERAYPFLDLAVDRFYDRLETHPGMRALATRDGTDPHLRQAIRAWLESSLRGPHGPELSDDLIRLGRVHARAGIPQPLMMAATESLRQGVCEIARQTAGDADPSALIASIDKLFGLELALLLEGYRAELEASGSAAPSAAEPGPDDETTAAKEGNGRRVDLVTGCDRPDPTACDELRNPLNAASLQLRVLAARLVQAGLDPEILEPLELARADVDRLSRAVDAALIRLARGGESRAEDDGPPGPAEPESGGEGETR